MELQIAFRNPSTASGWWEVSEHTKLTTILGPRWIKFTTLDGKLIAYPIDVIFSVELGGQHG